MSIAASLFATKGYEATSLRDIAEAAGLTKAALYYWFPEKEQLFQRVVAGRLEALLNRAREAVDSATNPIEKIRRFMLLAAEQMDDHRFAWEASANTFWSNFKPEQRRAIVPLRDGFEGLLRQCITDAVADGSLREVDPKIATKLLLSGLNMMPRWHKADGPLTAAQVVEQYLAIFFEGMRPR